MNCVSLNLYGVLTLVTQNAALFGIQVIADVISSDEVTGVGPTPIQLMFL